MRRLSPLFKMVLMQGSAVNHVYSPNKESILLVFKIFFAAAIGVMPKPYGSFIRPGPPGFGIQVACVSGCV